MASKAAKTGTEQKLQRFAGWFVPSPSHPSFCLAAVEKKSAFLHGCETKAGVGRTGNEARLSTGEGKWAVALKC